MEFNRLKRRQFITLVGGAAAWPLAARAQPPGKLVRVGYLSLSAGPNANTEGFQHGLRELGYAEGQNLVMLYRWASGQNERLVSLASELLELKVDVIASPTTEAVMAIRTINKIVPIVMTSVSDPIGSGLVASLARPGGNTTGVTLFATDLAGKRLELLRDMLPRLSRVAVLAQRDHPPTALLINETQAAANTLQIAVQTFEVRPGEIAEAFRSIAEAHPDAVIVQQTSTFNTYIQQIADLAISYNLPSIHQARPFVQVGGLMAYGPSIFALGHRAAWYVDRIVKGTSPADLPVEQPAKFQLIINLRTAKALGLDVPSMLLVRADELIE